MMKAVRFHGQKDIRLGEIEVPRSGKGQIKVGSNLPFAASAALIFHVCLGGAHLIPKDRPHPITKEVLPVVLGHELSGTVEEVGEEVLEIKVGDRVCVQPTICDRDCASCRRGLINCCEKNGFVGLGGWAGGVSEHVVVPWTSVNKLPENVSLEVGALVEPLAVGWHAVSISPYKAGDRVLVLGGGPIGLVVVKALKAKSCENIMVSEISPRRKQYASKFGAHHVLDPSQQDVVAEVHKLTDGERVDVVFDAAGAQAGIDVALLAIKAQGMLVNIAVWEKRATLNMNDLVFRERGFIGSATHAPGDFEQVIEAMSNGKLTPEAMITRRIRMDEIVDKGFSALVQDKDHHVKILADIGASM